MTMELKDVAFAYRPDRPVLDGVACRVSSGSVCALVGPNGAGKSTLLRLMLGTLRPRSGRVLLGGRAVQRLSGRDRARRIGYVAQRSALAAAFTVRELVRLGRFGVGRDDRAVEAALETMELTQRADEPYHNLSAGQQQRAALARVLAQLDVTGIDPASQVLLADEPTAAMDPRHALHTLRLLRRQAGAGRAVVVVLHDLTAALRFADEALVLDGGGRVARFGPATEALSPAVLEPVFGVRFLAIRAQGPGPGGAAAALVPGGDLDDTMTTSEP